MLSNEAGAELGNVMVQTTSFRGFTPEELADRAMEKILYVGHSAPPAIRDQALAYQADLRRVVLSYLQQAVQSHNTTIAHRLTQAGHPELVPLLDG